MENKFLKRRVTLRGLANSIDEKYRHLLLTYTDYISPLDFFNCVLQDPEAVDVLCFGDSHKIYTYILRAVGVSTFTCESKYVLNTSYISIGRICVMFKLLCVLFDFKDIYINLTNSPFDKNQHFIYTPHIAHFYGVTRKINNAALEIKYLGEV